jgi:hypothetical protein
MEIKKVGRQMFKLALSLNESNYINLGDNGCFNFISVVIFVNNKKCLRPEILIEGIYIDNGGKKYDNSTLDVLLDEYMPTITLDDIINGVWSAVEIAKLRWKGYYLTSLSKSKLLNEINKEENNEKNN